MPELRLGIAGLGSAGARHHRAALAHPRVRVVATADPAVAADHASVDALLGRDDLDAVVLALPNHLSAAATTAARRRGLAVLCEKPPARTPDELRPALGPGPVLRFAFNHRLHHAPQEAARRLPSLGSLREVRGVYQRPTLAPAGGWRADPEKAGGGVLLDQGIHLVDLARWLLGPLHVTSLARRGTPLETHVDALLRTGDGVPVHLVSSAEGAPRFELHLQGEAGSLTLRGLETSSRAYAPETLVRPDGTVRTWGDDPSWARQLDGFVRHVLDGDDDGHGAPDDALAVLELVHALRTDAPLREAS